MPKSRQQSSATQALGAAEQRLGRKKSDGPRPLSNAESAQLVQELKLRQIELELQITALRESREQAAAGSPSPRS